MSRTRNSRYVYGKCLNDNCSKAKNKEIIQLSLHADFLCPECGKKLTTARPPKSFLEKWGKLIYLIIGLLIVTGLVVWFCLLPKESEETSSNTEEVVKEEEEMPIEIKTETTDDSIDKVPIEEPATEEIQVIKDKNVPSVKKISNPPVERITSSNESSSNGKIRLSYGTYSGDIKGGYPDGMGRLVYTSSRQINQYDSKGRTASAGDYVIGEFVRGFFVQGKHYDSNGNLIETLMIGAPANNKYESK